MNGWVKIHRRMLEWEHFGEPSVVTVFLALLLTADQEGRTAITKGDIASITGLSHNTVSNAISKLVRSREISRLKYGSKITTTITNWSEYQSSQNLVRYQKPSTQKLVCNDTRNWDDINPKNGSIQYNKNNKNKEEVVADAHAHEEFVANALTDLAVERGCMAMRISPDEYRQLVTEVTNDWIFRNIPDNEWTLTHLLAQMRIKHNINKRNNGQHQITGQPSDPRTKLNQDAVKAMAALAAESQRPADVPF